jgi:hypothetical protein
MTIDLSADTMRNLVGVFLPLILKGEILMQEIDSLLHSETTTYRRVPCFIFLP